MAVDPRKGIYVLIGLLVTLISYNALAVEKQYYKRDPAANIQSPSPVAKPPAINKKPASLPDLLVEKIWLDRQCVLHFKIRNKGRAAIPAQEHKLAKVRLAIGSKNYFFSFIDPNPSVRAVDPRGNLRKPGGSVSFNSEKVISDQQPVRVLVDSGNRIRESATKNNARKTTLIPGCENPEAAAPVARKPMPTVSSRVSPASAAAMRPTVEILSFVVRKQHDTAVAARPGSEPDGETSIRVGQSVVMSWSIRTCHDNNLNVTIGAAIGAVPPGTQVESSPDCSNWRGSKTVTPNRNSTYILEASVMSTSRMNAVGTASVRVSVAAPVVDILTPEINDRERTIIFYVRNRGTLDYDASDVAITGRYSVTNWNHTISYASGDIEARNIALNAEERVEIGRVTLPEHPNPYAAETIYINLEVSDRAGFIADSSRQLNHAHRWRMDIKPVSADLLLSIVESQITGEIRLNNYEPPGSDRVADTDPPSVRNDSHVTIIDQTREFTIPWDTYDLKVNDDVVYRYVPFVHDINATVGGRGTGFIKIGGIGTRITFEVGGGNEIKGWKRENRTLVDSAPDINISKLEFEISANLSARDGRIQVDSVYIARPDMEFEITGHALAGLMNAFQSYFDTNVAGIIRSQVNTLLESANIKATMEAQINQALQEFGTGYIHRLTLDPSRGMTVTHVP